MFLNASFTKEKSDIYKIYLKSKDCNYIRNLQLAINNFLLNYTNIYEECKEKAHCGIESKKYSTF